ncbi:hypothetical protein [Erwinia mallotivora]|uniref:hypothetical protein n=1 Tax=Erwinia mallotivora TaxID=69222 RepID=UPI0021C24010|nr:hypothetical protein [Erwinia mallotivora]
MRELNCTEVSLVSGAGTSEVVSSLNTVMETISTTLASTVESLTSATDSREISGLFRKVMSLTGLYTKLTFITNLLSSTIADSSSSEETVTEA